MRMLSRKLRNLRIEIEHGAERGFQGPKPWLVVPPVVERLVVNRRTHLLRADGIDRAPVFVKSETRIFERQFQPVEQPANFPLRIRNQLLVEDSMNAARQHAVVM